MKNNKSKRSRKGKPNLRDRNSSKNMRRDVEIEDTARREYAADARERRDCYKSAANDPAWYAQNPQLMRDYASYPFGHPLGTRLNVGPNIGQSNINSIALAGIAAYYFVPTVGLPQSPNAPINVAARNIYSFVRHANSGHSNYDAPDLMLYLVAMDSIYMYHSFLKRALGLLYSYSTLNRYYPEVIIKAMGIDFDDISQHIPDLRGYINQYAVKMGSMCVPNSMSYMARHSWMCEGLYTDASDAKAQTYMYTPTSFFQFNLDPDGVGSLQYATWMDPAVYLPTGAPQLKTFTEIVTFGNKLLNAVLQEEDFNIMSGDILKAFGTDGVVKVSGVVDGYMILPVYNEEVLSQMENATILNGYFNNGLYQDNSINGGFLKVNATNFTHVVSKTINAGTSPVPLSAGIANQIIAPYTMNHILNFHYDDVDPSKVMVATRLTNIADPYSAQVTPLSTNSGLQIRMSIPTIASEVIVYGAMFNYYWNPDEIFILYTTPMCKYLPITGNDANTLRQSYDTLFNVEQFDWHPGIMPVLLTPNTNNTTVSSVTNTLGPIMDYSNYTIIDQANLINMTDSALLSMFSVPQMGAFSTKLV